MVCPSKISLDETTIAVWQTVNGFGSLHSVHLEIGSIFNRCSVPDLNRTHTVLSSSLIVKLQELRKSSY